MPSLYAVLGAGGPTGALVVKALSDQGHAVRAVVRDPAKVEGLFGAAPAPGDAAGGAGSVEVVRGDVTDPASMREALAGVSGAVFAASGSTYFSARAVDEEGLGNVARAAADVGGVSRVVAVSSALVSPHNRWHPIRLLLNSVRWGIMDAKHRGEEQLRRSGVPYTIIRPAGLTNDPPGGAALAALQGDRTSGRVARADVAAACAAALTDPAAANVTLELVGKAPRDGAPPAPLAAQLRSLFSGLAPDAPCSA